MRNLPPPAVLLIGVMAVSLLSAGCTPNADVPTSGSSHSGSPAAPQPSTSPAAPQPSTSPAAPQARDRPRFITHDRFDGTPTLALKAAFRQVDEFVRSHPDRFGGAYFNFNYSAIHVWTVGGAWQDPDFVRLRETLDPSGDFIANVGTGKPLTYLSALRNQLATRFHPGPQGKIAAVMVDPIYNAVRVQIRYSEGDVSLHRMPLALQIAAVAPEIVIESVGGKFTTN
jgi:hypothetical protein